MPNAIDEVMAVRGKGMPANDQMKITGADPVFSTKFKIGETCAAVIAGIGTAVSDIWELKTSRPQSATIDVRHATTAPHSSKH